MASSSSRLLLYTIVITTYIPPRQVGDGPWTPWYADYYHPEV